MSGELSPFYSARPGINQGRISYSSDTIEPIEGSFGLFLGSKQLSDLGWFNKGDYIEFSQNDTPPSNSKIFRMNGIFEGSDTPMPLLSDIVGPPNFFVLADGQTTIIEVDGTNQTITFNAASFVDITKATPDEVVAVINSQGSGLIASITGFGSFRVDSLGTGYRASMRHIGGTATALGLDTVGWKLTVYVDGDELASRVIRDLRSETLKDLAVNLAEYTAPFEITIRLELSIL